jgi:hypothetical protein
MVMNTAAGLAIVVGSLACCTLTKAAGLHSGEANGLVDPWVLPQGILQLQVALGVGALGIGLYALWRRFTRRADTPLLPPHSDPLATYRQGGPQECPRPPFAT